MGTDLVRIAVTRAAWTTFSTTRIVVKNKIMLCAFDGSTMHTTIFDGSTISMVSFLRDYQRGYPEFVHVAFINVDVHPGHVYLQGSSKELLASQ